MTAMTFAACALMFALAIVGWLALAWKQDADYLEQSVDRLEGEKRMLYRRLESLAEESHRLKTVLHDWAAEEMKHWTGDT